MGERYDPSWQLTVDQLISYRLLDHQALIDAVYSRAQSEYQLEQKLTKLEKMWSSNEIYFKLAKHIPDSVYTAGMASRPAWLFVRSTEVGPMCYMAAPFVWVMYYVCAYIFWPVLLHSTISVEIYYVIFRVTLYQVSHVDTRLYQR